MRKKRRKRFYIYPFYSTCFWVLSFTSLLELQVFIIMRVGEKMLASLTAFEGLENFMEFVKKTQISEGLSSYKGKW